MVSPAKCLGQRTEICVIGFDDPLLLHLMKESGSFDKKTDPLIGIPMRPDLTEKCLVFRTRLTLEMNLEVTKA